MKKPKFKVGDILIYYDIGKVYYTGILLENDRLFILWYFNRGVPPGYLLNMQNVWNYGTIKKLDPKQKYEYAML